MMLTSWWNQQRMSMRWMSNHANKNEVGMRGWKESRSLVWLFHQREVLPRS
jgi:hypothetical protein